MSERGRLFVVSGPSGVGKSTVISEILKLDPNICFSVSATTRPPRPGEINGKDYCFVSRDEFLGMIARHELLEYAEYVGKFYGTPLGPIESELAAGRDVLLDIEVQGAMQVRQRRQEAILIFITPPDLDTLRCRLLERGTDDAETIEKRVCRAEEELCYMDKYDHVVINDTISNAVRQLEEIFRKAKE